LQRPEGKENHHHDLVYEICKTFIPGSNPGGASKILKKSALLPRERTRHRPGLAGLKTIRPTMLFESIDPLK
jgi:hypothetical protein